MTDAKRTNTNLKLELGKQYDTLLQQKHTDYQFVLGQLKTQKEQYTAKSEEYDKLAVELKRTRTALHSKSKSLASIKSTLSDRECQFKSNAESIKQMEHNISRLESNLNQKQRQLDMFQEKLKRQEIASSTKDTRSTAVQTVRPKEDPKCIRKAEPVIVDENDARNRRLVNSIALDLLKQL